MNNYSQQNRHIVEDWSRDCELLLVEILERGSFWGCGRVWEGSREVWGEIRSVLVSKLVGAIITQLSLAQVT